MSLSSASFAISRRLDARKPTEFEKNFSSLEFEVRQLALQLQLEKRALEETEKLTAEKEKEVKQTEYEISTKDMEMRRLHKQFKQNRETCESLKKTASIFQEQAAGMEKVLAEEKKKTETKRTELQGHVTKYERLWVQYQLRYESSKLAQDVKKCKEITQQYEEEVHSLHLEYNELNTQITANQPGPSVNQWVIQIAEVRSETDCIVSEIKTTRLSIKQKKNELQSKKQVEKQNQIQRSVESSSQLVTEQRLMIHTITNNGREIPTQLQDVSKQRDTNGEAATQLPPPQPVKKLSTSFQLFIPRLQSPRVSNKDQSLTVAPTVSPAPHIEVPRHTSQMPHPPRTPVTNSENQDVVSYPMHTQEGAQGLEETQSMVVTGISQGETERENSNDRCEQQSHHSDGELQDCGTRSMEMPSQQPTLMDTEVYCSSTCVLDGCSSHLSIH